MRNALFVMPLVVTAAVVACGQAGLNTVPPAPTLAPDLSPSTFTPEAPRLPTVEATLVPAEVPPTTVPPTPTSFADGLNVRLGTPDPNPNCPAHYPWFFDNHAGECGDFVHNTWTVLQPFERGLMVWSQDRGRTWVLLDDGSPFKLYQIVSDPQGVPLPEPDPSLVPPEGFYQPERGFALFWRSLVPGHEWVRAHLGWATAPETAYSAFWQCSTATGDAARCYFNGPRDEIIVLAMGSAPYWTYLQTAVR